MRFVPTTTWAHFAGEAENVSVAMQESYRSSVKHPQWWKQYSAPTFSTTWFEGNTELHYPEHWEMAIFNGFFETCLVLRVCVINRHVRDNSNHELTLQRVIVRPLQKPVDVCLRICMHLVSKLIGHPRPLRMGQASWVTSPWDELCADGFCPCIFGALYELSRLLCGQSRSALGAQAQCAAPCQGDSPSAWQRCVREAPTPLKLDDVAAIGRLWWAHAANHYDPSKQSLLAGEQLPSIQKQIWMSQDCADNVRLYLCDNRVLSLSSWHKQLNSQLILHVLGVSAVYVDEKWVLEVSIWAKLEDVVVVQHHYASFHQGLMGNIQCSFSGGLVQFEVSASVVSWGGVSTIQCWLSAEEWCEAHTATAVELLSEYWGSLRVPFCVMPRRQLLNLTVCGHPRWKMKGKHRIVEEWLEYHLAMGASHFFLYDVDGSLAQIVRPYQLDGLVTYFPRWSLFSSDLQDGFRHHALRFHAHPQASAHCSFANRGVSKWVWQAHNFDDYLAPREMFREMGPVQDVVTDFLQWLDMHAKPVSIVHIPAVVFFGRRSSDGSLPLFAQWTESELAGQCDKVLLQGQRIRHKALCQWGNVLANPELLLEIAATHWGRGRPGTCHVDVTDGPLYVRNMVGIFGGVSFGDPSTRQYQMPWSYTTENIRLSLQQRHLPLQRVIIPCWDPSMNHVTKEACCSAGAELVHRVACFDHAVTRADCCTPREPPSCAWSNGDQSCAEFEIRDYMIGKLGGDACPAGSSSIVNPTACYIAARTLGKEFSEHSRSNGRCVWWGSGDALAFARDLPSVAKLVCLRVPALIRNQALLSKDRFEMELPLWPNEAPAHTTLLSDERWETQSIVNSPDQRVWERRVRRISKQNNILLFPGATARIWSFSRAPFNPDWGSWPQLKTALDVTKARVVLDVGANLGIGALAICKYCPTCTVYALEPFVPTFRYLVWNARLNNCTRQIRPLNLAVGPWGKPVLAYSPTCPSLSGFSPRLSGSSPLDHRACLVAMHKQQVQRVPLDWIASSLNFRPPWVLKLDCRGCEYLLGERAVQVVRRSAAVVGELHRHRDKSLLRLARQLCGNASVWDLRSHEIGAHGKRQEIRFSCEGRGVVRSHVVAHQLMPRPTGYGR